MVLRLFERDYPEHWDPEVYEETKRTGKFWSPMSDKKQPVTRHGLVGGVVRFMRLTLNRCWRR